MGICFFMHQLRPADHILTISKFLGNQIQSEISCDQPPDDQYSNLNDVCVSDDFHTAKRHNNGEDSQTDYTDNEINTRYGSNGQRPQIDDRRKVYKNVNEQPEYCHNGTYSAIVP